MLDIKEIITILCKYLHDTIHSTLTPEHFRLAKYDKKSDDVINALWTTLDRLTLFALKDVNDQISFHDFDMCIKTKLRLAYLQYPSTEIYSLSNSVDNCSTRELLLALEWLITKFEVLNSIVRLKLLKSSLGKEFSKLDAIYDVSDDSKLSTIHNQINNLLHKTNQIGNNLKAISELYTEKVKLMTRVHAASITTSGLPHLTVSEMSLIKKIAANGDNKSSLEQHKIKEMEKTASLLDTHMKWTKKNHIFHTWMGTVLDEYEKAGMPEFTKESAKELTKFIYLLRHSVKKRLKMLKNNYNYSSTSSKIDICPSRLLRIQKCNTEVSVCLNETKNLFEHVDENLKKKRVDFEIELKKILTAIPNCVRV